MYTRDERWDTRVEHESHGGCTHTCVYENLFALFLAHPVSTCLNESQVENFISNATALAARSSSSEGAPAPPSDTSNYSSLGTFDFVSVCPPYKKVDYVDMLDNLSKSPLISGSSYVMIEFPSEVWRTHYLGAHVYIRVHVHILMSIGGQ